MLGQDYQTDPDRKAHIRELAEQIAYTCWQMYEQQPTGIAPERVKSMAMDLSKTDTREYILRPEALEGFWYMWELTGDSKYREWSWKIFENFQKYLKVRIYAMPMLKFVVSNIVHLVCFASGWIRICFVEGRSKPAVWQVRPNGKLFPGRNDEVHVPPPRS